MTDPGRTVVVVALWVDEPPPGELPPRALGLKNVACDHGFRLAVIPHRTLDVTRWLAAPPAGLILSGSRLHLGEDCTPEDFPETCAWLDQLPQVPVLGICFGHQFLAYGAGGRLERLAFSRSAVDWPVRHEHAHPVFAQLPDPCSFAENHRQRVAEVGRGFRVIAASDDGIEAMAHDSLPRLGVQFHPEYFPEQARPYGRIFLNNWFHSLAQAGPGRRDHDAR